MMQKPTMHYRVAVALLCAAPTCAAISSWAAAPQAESSAKSRSSTKSPAKTEENAAADRAEAERAPTQVRADDVPEGHSYHGDAFDEGPRQAAYLMSGMGNVSFPIVTSVPEAQKYFDQGVAQLHGFWYFEAERSFRQVAALDPDCVMAYWGMTLANVNNTKRAEKFIAEAVKRRETAVDRERMWIDAWAAFYKADPKKDKERRQALVNAIEAIVLEYPDDLEAKAQLVLQMWMSRGSIPITSKRAVEALIAEVLAANPMHPIHHYRIHLWDEGHQLEAVPSAGLCGQSTPGIAHMWHMSGHTFSGLKRYADGAWQQEAASRVDHAYMMRDYVMPDQIHNYAHNHEWLIRNLGNLGRAHYGLALAKNLTEMPRHPKYNTAAKRGSAALGRARTIEILEKFEMWDDVVALAATPYLEPTDVPRDQVKRLRLLGTAHYERGDLSAGREVLSDLEKQLADEKKKQQAAGDKAADEAKKKQPATKPNTSNATTTKPSIRSGGNSAPASTQQQAAPKQATPKPSAPSSSSTSNSAAKDAEKKPSTPDPVAKARQDAENPFRAQIAVLEAAIADLKGREALRDKKYDEAIKLFKTAGITSGEYLSRVQLAAGNTAEAERLARDAAKRGDKQVVPLANLTFVLRQAKKKEEARQKFEELRKLAAASDLDLPPFERLKPFAAELKWPGDWRLQPELRKDIGDRPPLDSLGPIRWSPSAAPSFRLTTADGKSISLEDYRGKNVVFVFYLGFGCLHCVDQLRALGPLTKEFRAAGIDVVAVSTDTAEVNRRAEADLKPEEKYPFPILSNPELDMFKKYRAYDDFEHQPLHATVFVDSAGKIRWYDGGAEPFMDLKFLLTESKRLLSLTSPSPDATAGPLKE